MYIYIVTYAPMIRISIVGQRRRRLNICTRAVWLFWRAKTCKNTHGPSCNFTYSLWKMVHWWRILPIFAFEEWRCSSFQTIAYFNKTSVWSHMLHDRHHWKTKPTSTKGSDVETYIKYSIWKIQCRQSFYYYIIILQPSLG